MTSQSPEHRQIHCTANARPLPKEQSDAVVGELRKAIAAANNNARRVK